MAYLCQYVHLCFGASVAYLFAIDESYVLTSEVENLYFGSSAAHLLAHETERSCVLKLEVEKIRYGLSSALYKAEDE